MRQMPKVRLVLVMLLLAQAEPGFADAPQATALADAVARVDGLAALEGPLQTCPADLYAAHMQRPSALKGSASALDEGACADDIDACARLCLTRNDGGACLELAIMIELADVPDQQLAARKLHARACALGQAGGCTNRGGAIRNVPLAGDPLSLSSGPSHHACLFRTFEAACAGGDSWGCAMSGQTYALGEGVVADKAQAIALYQRACHLADDPDFAACVYARQSIEEIGAD